MLFGPLQDNDWPRVEANKGGTGFLDFSHRPRLK
jgi:hypothetical protein